MSIGGVYHAGPPAQARYASAVNFSDISVRRIRQFTVPGYDAFKKS
jgi:hypothetical protein